jgi:hypothetical protein
VLWQGIKQKPYLVVSCHLFGGGKATRWRQKAFFTGCERYLHSMEHNYLLAMGQCYNHNFLRYSPIFGEKMSFFLKTNVMILIWQKLALFCSKNAF